MEPLPGLQVKMSVENNIEFCLACVSCAGPWTHAPLVSEEKSIATASTMDISMDMSMDISMDIGCLFVIFVRPIGTAFKSVFVRQDFASYWHGV